MKFTKSNRIRAQRLWLLCILLLFCCVSASDSIDLDSSEGSDDLIDFLSDPEIASQYSFQSLADPGTRLLQAESRDDDSASDSYSEEELAQSHDFSSSDDDESLSPDVLPIQQIYSRLLDMTGESESSTGGKREEKKAKKKAKKFKKKAKKAKKTAKKAKKELKKLKRKLTRFATSSGSTPPFNSHEEGLTEDLLHKDLTLIPRKKLLSMAKVCKTRKAHYKWELAQCVQQPGSRRRECLDIFNKVKNKIEFRCSRLKELFTRIFKFINNLRVWARNKTGSGGSVVQISDKDAGNRFLGLMHDLRMSKGYEKRKIDILSDGSSNSGSLMRNENKLQRLITKSGKKSVSKRKLKKMVKKEAKKIEKKTKKAQKKLKKMVKKLQKKADKNTSKKTEKKLKKIVKKLEKKAKKGSDHTGKKLKKVIKKLEKKAAKNSSRKEAKKIKKLIKKVEKKAAKGSSKTTEKKLKKLVKKVEKMAQKKGTSAKKTEKKLKKLIKKVEKKAKKKGKSSKKQEKKLKKILKKVAKKAEKRGQRAKKVVKKLQKTLKKGLKEARGTNRKKQYLKQVKKKLKKQIRRDERKGKSTKVEKKLLKKVKKTEKKVKKALKKKAKGCRGLKKMLDKVRRKGKNKSKRKTRFKKLLKKLEKKGGDKSSGKGGDRVRWIKKIVGKEQRKDRKKYSKKKQKKKMKKLLKKLDKRETSAKRKRGKFLKKLVKREAKKEVKREQRKAGGGGDGRPMHEIHREAGETFLDWLRMKKGSNKKMKDWVKAKLAQQAQAYQARTKVSKKEMRSCIYRKDYRYGGEKMGRSTQAKVEGCCDACSNTSGCRAWSWDRKTKECTLISKVDKTGKSSTCCIAGRRKSKLVQTSKGTGKRLKKKLGKEIDKMEMKKLNGQQKHMLKKLESCKKDAKEFVKYKKKCGKKSKGNSSTKECFRQLKKYEEKVKKCKHLKSKAEALNKKIKKHKEKAKNKKKGLKKLAKKLKKANRKEKKKLKVKKKEAKKLKKEAKKEKKEAKKVLKKAKKEAKKAAKNAKKDAKKALKKDAKKAKKAQKKSLKKLVKKEKKELSKQKKAAKYKKKEVKKELKKEIKELKKEAKDAKKEAKTETKKAKKEEKKEAKILKKMAKKAVTKAKKKAKKLTKKEKKKAKKEAKVLKKLTKKALKKEKKDVDKSLRKAKKYRKQAKKEAKKNAKREKTQVKKIAKAAKKEAKKLAKAAKKDAKNKTGRSLQKAKKIAKKAKKEAKKMEKKANNAAKKAVKKAEKEANKLQKKVEKKSRRSRADKSAEAAMIMERSKSKSSGKSKCKKCKNAGTGGSGGGGGKSGGISGARAKAAAIMNKKGSKPKSSGKKKCKNCSTKKKSSGKVKSPSGKSGGIYDYFSRPGRQKAIREFGFHRSKMKNYKKDRYRRGDAVATANDGLSSEGGDAASDWTDFGNRRKLVEVATKGLLSDYNGDSALGSNLLNAVSGRHNRIKEKVKKSLKKKLGKLKGITKKKMKDMKKAVKKVKKALKKKLDKMAKKGEKEEEKMRKKALRDSRVTNYEPAKNLGSLVVRNVDDPEETKMQIAKLESKLEKLNKEIKRHRKSMMRHIKTSEHIAPFKDRFKSFNDEMQRQRKRIMRRMKKKYKNLQEEQAKRKVWRDSYESKINDLEGAFRGFKHDMMNKMHEKQSSDILQRLDKIQDKFQEQKMKKKAMHFVAKMAKKIGKKVKRGDDTNEKMGKLVQKMKGQQSVKDEARKDQKMLNKVARMAAGISKEGISEGWAWKKDRPQMDDDVWNYFKGTPIPDSAKGFGHKYGSNSEPKKESKSESKSKSERAPEKKSTDTTSIRKMAKLKKKAEKFAKTTASFLTGEFIQHRCRKKLRRCKARLNRHLKTLRECEKSEGGDNAPCWEEVKQTNELVMRDFARCRQLRKSCESDSLKDKLDPGKVADPCSFLDEFDPDKEAKCDRLRKKAKREGKSGLKFKDRVANDVKSMTDEFSKEAEALTPDEKDRRRRRGRDRAGDNDDEKDRRPPVTSTTPNNVTTTLPTTSTTPNETHADTSTKGNQIIIKGGVQHFYLHPAGSGKKKGDGAQSSEDLEFDGPQIDVDTDDDNGSKTDLSDPYLTSTAKLMKDKNLVKNNTGSDLSETELQDLYDFFKADASKEREPVKDYNKPFGYHIDKSQRKTKKGKRDGAPGLKPPVVGATKTARLRGWAGKKYRQFTQFFGRRTLSDVSPETLSNSEDA